MASSGPGVIDLLSSPEPEDGLTSSTASHAHSASLANDQRSTSKSAEQAVTTRRSSGQLSPVTSSTSSVTSRDTCGAGRDKNDGRSNRARNEVSSGSLIGGGRSSRRQPNGHVMAAPKRSDTAYAAIGPSAPDLMGQSVDSPRPDDADEPLRSPRGVIPNKQLSPDQQIRKSAPLHSDITGRQNSSHTVHVKEAARHADMSRLGPGQSERHPPLSNGSRRPPSAGDHFTAKEKAHQPPSLEREGGQTSDRRRYRIAKWRAMSQRPPKRPRSSSDGSPEPNNIKRHRGPITQPQVTHADTEDDDAQYAGILRMVSQSDGAAISHLSNLASPQKQAPNATNKQASKMTPAFEALESRSFARKPGSSTKVPINPSASTNEPASKISPADVPLEFHPLTQAPGSSKKTSKKADVSPLPSPLRSVGIATLPLDQTQALQPMSDEKANPRPQIVKLTGTQKPPPTPPVAPGASIATHSSHGAPYTAADDALIVRLKKVEKLTWDEVARRFNGRTKGSLQMRYSTKLSDRHPYAFSGTKPQIDFAASAANSRLQKQTAARAIHLTESHESASDMEEKNLNSRSRPVRRSALLAKAELNNLNWGRRLSQLEEPASSEDSSVALPRVRRQSEQDDQSRSFTHREQALESFAKQDSAFPSSGARLLRQRELGAGGARGWRSSTRNIPSELKNHVLDTLGPHKYFTGTSGDVNSVAWSPDGVRFAASSIAVSDERSMQYNNPLNLLVGDAKRGVLKELPEHHIQRPLLSDNTNVNAEHSMRQSQDLRLFMTVSVVQFNPRGSRMYSAGSDNQVRAYKISPDVDDVEMLYSIPHSAPVDLLSVSSSETLATGSRCTGDDSIRLYRHERCEPVYLRQLSSRHVSHTASRLSSFPSALRWGLAPHHKDYLLVGFASSANDDRPDTHGKTCLWDVKHGELLEAPFATRNVFDVAWNPNPSSGSNIFAVASVPAGNSTNKGTHSIVSLFAPKDGREASKTMTWECPAMDINDVLFCPHNDYLIAAGATDGKAYVWDIRSASRGLSPLHVLAHDEPLTILDHNRSREEADTGIRFLSWGENTSRLFTGSSDGAVKMWNPLRAPANAHVKDVATFSTAIMSGAFSPDFRELLVGEDKGRINLLTVGHERAPVRTLERFTLHSARPPDHPAEPPFEAAKHLLDNKQIVLRPMGALPIRQAVQGPEYDGPYSAPSHTVVERAERAVLRADLELQNVSIAADEPDSEDSSESDNSEAEAGVAGKQATLRNAQATLQMLRQKEADAAELVPKATALQVRFKKMEAERSSLQTHLGEVATPCKLDCSYLPTELDQDGKVVDSGRSQHRIPHRLRISPVVGASAIAAGLTATCTNCSAPAAPSEDRAKPSTCERCGFSCLRCGQAVEITSEESILTCKPCGLAWEANVLGYDLIAPSSNERRGTGRMRITANGSSVEEEELGYSEREYYSSLWQHPR